MVTVAAACLTVIAAAPTAASATASRDEYAHQADPVCSATDQASKRQFARFVKADRHLRFHAAGNALAAIGTNIASGNAKLRLIAPFPGDEARISQWLGIWDQIAHTWNPLAASAYRLGEYKRLGNLFRQINRLAATARNLVSDYPFRSCA